MTWSPPNRLVELVNATIIGRREALQPAVRRETKELEAQLAARGTLLGGGRIRGQQEIWRRHFSNFAIGTIEDVLGLVRELHGDIPVDAAPWLRDTLLRAIEPMADRMATDVFELATKMNVNTSRDGYYPGAEVATVRRRIDIELGKAAYKAELRQLTPPPPSPGPTAAGADVFISHASEDKEDVARPLWKRIRASGFSAWLDQAEIKLGDRLLDKIDDGIANCRFGVVILSPHFFGKHWTRRELAGLAAREDAEDRKLILPVWHLVSQVDVTKHSPLLAGVRAALTSNGLDVVADEIVSVLKS